LVLFNNSIPAREVLEFILVIIPQVHQHIQLFKTDKLVLNNFLPNRPQNWLIKLLLLHDVNNCINGFLSSEELL
jgi:hypothetical protein